MNEKKSPREVFNALSEKLSAYAGLSMLGWFALSLLGFIPVVGPLFNLLAVVALVVTTATFMVPFALGLALVWKEIAAPTWETIKTRQPHYDGNGNRETTSGLLGYHIAPILFAGVLSFIAWAFSHFSGIGASYASVLLYIFALPMAAVAAVNFVVAGSYWIGRGVAEWATRERREFTDLVQQGSKALKDSNSSSSGNGE